MFYDTMKNPTGNWGFQSSYDNAYIRAVDKGSPVDVEKHYGVNKRNAFTG